MSPTEARDRIATELERHRSTFMGAPSRPAWLDCSCGWSSGQLTKSTGGLTGAQTRWKLHRAEALLPILESTPRLGSK